MKLRCEIVGVTYNNADSGWGVLQTKAEGEKDVVTIVGMLADVSKGSTIEVEGSWRNDPKFGKQFAVTSWTEIMPATTEGLIKYLGSGRLYGVGPHFAKLIVDRFGMDTLNILDNDVEKLLEIPNLGKKKLQRIVESWEKQKSISTVSMFLQQHGVSAAYANRIYQKYGNDTIDIVKGNPYKLVDDIWGIGFKYADAVALTLGYDVSDPRRIRSGVLYSLTHAADTDGHLYLTRDKLLNITAKLLDIESDNIASQLDVMISAKDVIADDDAIYVPYYYHAEVGVAHRLKEMTTSRSIIDNDEVVSLMERALKAAEKNGVQYDEHQIDAVRKSLQNSVMVLTGGPGTGKTTTTKAIIDAFKSANKKILLAAPTGRAAKRMAEATEMEAKTIHRLLEYSPVVGWGRDEDNQLEGDVLIVDECSMIDLMLFYHLLKAMPRHMNLLLVGDIDQLPSVGAGNVLHDVIMSQAIPVVRLTNIFRQAQSSRIVMSAHAINHGAMPNLTNGRDTDFFFIPTVTDNIADTVVNLVCRRLPAAYQVKPTDIQVLTPMHKGDAGAINLNLLLQGEINRQSTGMERAGTTYKVGDKVMQIRNNYDKRVFNGDIGFVSSINVYDKALKVDFDGTEVEYEQSELDELTLAYCVTIHKSQGCEFPIIVIPVTRRHSIMLRRNLLYTGITRAKRICVLVGDVNAISLAVSNSLSATRNTRLCERLKTLS